MMEKVRNGARTIVGSIFKILVPATSAVGLSMNPIARGNGFEHRMRKIRRRHGGAVHNDRRISGLRSRAPFFFPSERAVSQSEGTKKETDAKKDLFHLNY